MARAPQGGGRRRAAEMEPLFRKAFPRERFVVVSNREPYEHRWTEDPSEVVVKRPAGGLTSALDPLMQALGGTWVAWGSGDADAAVVDDRDRVEVPPDDPSYRLRRLWFDQRDITGFYLGYSNQFLWPLCHLRPALTRVRASHWRSYEDVNRRFAEAVLEEVGGDAAAVWFQDYHLALAPRFVRSRRGDIALAHFWHIPWPPLEIFRVAPQARALLEGLLANDLVGFHIPSYALHFLHAAQALVGARIDWDAMSARHGDHTCHVRGFPISIDLDAALAAASSPATEAQLRRFRERHAPEGGRIGIGVDRLDYSKGLPEKMKALDELWTRHPELRERFTFVQVAVPSRTDIEAYDELNHIVERQVRQINERHGTASWSPIHLIRQALPAERLAVLYRAGDLCIVSSLQDGMNLVAMEYVASRIDATGALVLSEFTGAAAVLDGFWPANPYDPETFGQLIHEALTASETETARRMVALKRSLRTIYDWLADIFETWGRVSHGAPPRPDAAAALEALSARERFRR